MGDFVLSIRGEFPVPPGVSSLELELLRRFVSDMYADAVIGGSSSCMLAGPEKSEFQHWHDDPCHIHSRPAPDFHLDRREIREWLENA